MTEPARAVLFDLDNTLVLEDACTLAAVRTAADRACASGRADAGTIAAAAIDIAEREWQSAPVFVSADALGIWWGEALWGGFTGDSELMREIRAFVPGFRRAVWRAAAAAGGPQDQRLALELQEGYISARRAAELIDPDAGALLQDLARDHRLALVTNGAGDVQREKLSRTNFAEAFGAIVISGEIGVGKPDPRLYSHALAAIGVDAAEATMVGDSLERDVAGAQRSGIRTIWLDRGLAVERHASTDERPTPDARIERLSDLRVALDALERRPASPPARL